jgi:guanylate kinase
MNALPTDRWHRSDVSFPIVVSGPSGVGKTSLVTRLLALDPLCVRSVSATTRTPRGGEREGQSYFFVDQERFLQMRERAELVESAIYRDCWYGTPKAFLKSKLDAGVSVVLNIEVQGGLQVKAHDPGSVLIFILPPSWEDLRRRLTGRGTDTPESIEGRIRRGMEELERIRDYDYVVVNDDLDRCAADLAAIVRAERRRRTRLERA